MPPVMTIPIDLENHFRYYLLIVLVIGWFVLSRYGSTLLAIAKSALIKMQASGGTALNKGSLGWLAALCVLVLFGPGIGTDPPTPVPDVIVNPDPVKPDPIKPDPVRPPDPAPQVKKDLFDRATSLYRQLLADAIEEYAVRDYAGDDEAAKYLNQKIDAAVQGSMAEFDAELKKATHAGPERAKAFSVQLRENRVEVTP